MLVEKKTGRYMEPVRNTLPLKMTTLFPLYTKKKTSLPYPMTVNYCISADDGDCLATSVEFYIVE
jgi:hypothetical protein